MYSQNKISLTFSRAAYNANNMIYISRGFGNSHAASCMQNSLSITVTCRQEIIKRYPEWRKYYRHISETPRVVDDGGEREMRQQRKNGTHNRTPYVATRVTGRSLTGSPCWAITPFFVT